MSTRENLVVLIIKTKKRLTLWVFLPPTYRFYKPLIPLKFGRLEKIETFFYTLFWKMGGRKWEVVVNYNYLVNYGGEKVLIGGYTHNIDAKGRLIMPAKFRPSLGEKFIITRGLDGCLFGYPKESWERLEAKLVELPLAKKEARAFTRFFYSAATEVEIDKQGRINIPQSLIDFAKIEKECRVIGVSNRIEIWSSEQYEAYNEEFEDDFDDIAESMLDYGF